MDDDVDMEEDEEEGENEDQDQEITPVVVEIKPPDTSAPMKIVKDYTPKGMFLYNILFVLLFLLTSFIIIF
jgi:hypothetical protein